MLAPVDSIPAQQRAANLHLLHMQNKPQMLGIQLR